MSTETPDIKPRSRTVTDGLERAAARGMLRAVGMGDDDWVKPQIGIASSWNEITPCNLSLDRLADAAKNGVHAARRLPARVRHHLGLRRHLDGPRGHALLAGEPRGHRRLGRDACSRPSASTAACCSLGATSPSPRCSWRPPASTSPRCSSTPGRSCRAGSATRTSRSSTRSRPSAPAPAGLITREEVDAIERAICPGEGACGGMYTANTMAAAAEAMGMSLPGSAAPPAVDRRRDGYAHRSGEAVVELLRRGITTRDIITRESLLNAIAVVVALGGSTNAVLHLLGHRARGARAARHRGLQHRRRQGAAPGQREALRPVRHERRRPHRRHPGGHEGAARRRPAQRRLPHRDRQDDGREPRRDRPAGPGRQDPARPLGPDPQDRRARDPQRARSLPRAPS